MAAPLPWGCLVRIAFALPPALPMRATWHGGTRSPFAQHAAGRESLRVLYQRTLGIDCPDRQCQSECSQLMRPSKSLCAAVAETLTGFHDTLDAVFKSAGVPGDPPKLAQHSKWKEWLFQAGQDPAVDSLTIAGNLLEEFMDVAPPSGTPGHRAWTEKRNRMEQVLEEHGLRYYRFGQVMPVGEMPKALIHPTRGSAPVQTGPAKPDKLEDLLETLIKGLRRAMHPSSHRRKGSQPLSFKNEYDVQISSMPSSGPGSKTSDRKSSRRATLDQARGWIFCCRHTIW